MRRLAERGRDIWTPSQHSLFVKTFRDIADQFHLPLIDTTHLLPAAAAAQIVARTRETRTIDSSIAI